MGIQRINVVGVPVDVCRPEDLETEILELLAKPGTKQIVFLNIWGLLKARRKNDFAECVKNADLIIPISKSMAERRASTGREWESSRTCLPASRRNTPVGMRSQGSSKCCMG